MNTYKILIKGIVQGVGFRPFVYRLANELKLKGEVLNSSLGVEITINSTKSQLDTFLERLQKELPPLSQIDSIEYSKIDYIEFEEFRIVQTANNSLKTALLPPDISICKECEAELFDESNRRYLYPFITCTNCGVRYSIIYKLPYDRENTSMRFFKMCKSCQAEYNNPLDRRYHAQPIACWECGPILELKIKNEKLKIEEKNIINKVVALLKEGKILAIKGVGGYHLVCDATNKEAILRLRKRKNRPTKPFAVMVRDIDRAKEIAYISVKEEELLDSQAKPIVICKSKKSQIAIDDISPNISKIGIFLPYTPLHLLILDILNRPIVATSANLSDEPICTDLESIKRLDNVYDALLEHNREIVNGCDDSVLMVVAKQTITLRRARGYTPMSIKLPFKLTQNRLALGANQKNTIAIGFDDNVILSPHIGNLDGIASVEYFRENIENLERIYEFEPEVVVCDKHPNYESTKFAKELAMSSEKLEIKEVQHHYAHILAVMAEYQIKSRVLGVSFDGTGFGDDGRLWGGEFLLCDYKSYERVAHLKYFKLLGGEKAIREPRRVALSLLFESFGERAKDLDSPTIRAFSSFELDTLYTAWQKGLNAPQSSSMGRVFDAVASLLDIKQIVSFEGESGLLLEEFYDRDIDSSYSFEIRDGVIDIDLMIREIISEQSKEVAVSKFFNTVIEIIKSIYRDYREYPLVVSGGVFQNSILLELLLREFEDIYIPSKIPPNDGGIALGEIVWGGAI